MSIRETVVSLGALQSFEEKELGLRPTRFDWIHIVPARPVVGDLVKITAKMAFHRVPPLCWWVPFTGREVWLVIDDREITSVRTDSDGVASFTYAFPSAGTYAVKCVYKGEWDFSGSESTTVYVKVITEEQHKEEELRFWLMIAGGGIGAVAIIGGILYYIGETERRHLMMAALARR